MGWIGADVQVQRDEKGRIKKGSVLNPEGAGASSTNRHNLVVKRMVEEAVVRLGEAIQKKRPTLRDIEPGVAWLMAVGEKDPVAVLNMLKHVTPAAPKQIDVAVTMQAERMVEVMTQRRQELAARKERVLRHDTLDADFEEITDADTQDD